MKLILKLCLALLVPQLAIADQNDLKTGENLITQFGPEFVDYDMYQPFTMDEHNSYIQVWKSRKRGFSDHYAINIVSAAGKNLTDFKTTQDEPAKRVCIKHSATPAQEKIVNGYQTMSWQSVCEQEKLTITSIEMAILGNDRFYHLRKMWKFPIPEEKITEWQQLLDQTQVCDTNNANHPCPQ